MKAPSQHQPDIPRTGDTEAVEERVRALLAGQAFAVLCTQRDGQPYGSVVALAYSPDLRRLAFATPTESHKYRQLAACDRVALVVDSRPAQSGQIMQGEALTATGRAIELAPGAERQEWATQLAARHPQIAPFFSDPSSALFRVDVDQYVHVSRFQNVQRWALQESGPPGG